MGLRRVHIYASLRKWDANAPCFEFLENGTVQFMDHASAVSRRFGPAKKLEFKA
jgi:hypothetical protein